MVDCHHCRYRKQKLTEVIKTVNFRLCLGAGKSQGQNCLLVQETSHWIQQNWFNWERSNLIHKYTWICIRNLRHKCYGNVSNFWWMLTILCFKFLKCWGSPYKSKQRGVYFNVSLTFTSFSPERFGSKVWTKCSIFFAVWKRCPWQHGFLVRTLRLFQCHFFLNPESFSLITYVMWMMLTVWVLIKGFSCSTWTSFVCGSGNKLCMWTKLYSCSYWPQNQIKHNEKIIRCYVGKDM